MNSSCAIPAAHASPQTSHQVGWVQCKVSFWQIQTGLKPNPGALEVAELSTTHGTLPQSFKVSLIMFLRVKGLMHYSNQYFVSCLFFSHTGCKCLIVFLEYT